MQAVDFLVKHHFQDMRVPADEQFGLMQVKQFSGFWIVAGRIASDMSHQYLHPLTLKREVLRKNGTYILPIDIAVNASERFELFQRFGNTGSKVTGMPNFVAVFEMIENSFIQKAMGVGEEADASQYGVLYSKLSCNCQNLI